MPNALISMTTCLALGLGLGNFLVDEAVEAAEFLQHDRAHGNSPGVVRG
jgi:hypothetical protein